MNDPSFSNHLANLRYSLVNTYYAVFLLVNTYCAVFSLVNILNRYSVCVRRESGYCSIDWSVGSSNEVSHPLNVF